MADVADQLATLTDGLGLTETQLAQLTANFAQLRNDALIELATDTAKAENGSIMTRNGLDVLAKALAGKELQYTRVAFGDSMVDEKFIEVTDTEAVEFNALLHERKDFPMVDVSFTGGGTCTIKVAVNNEDVNEGFWIREIGVFALDPDTGEEILYCYKNFGVLANYLPSNKSDIKWTVYLNIITVVDNATNVTAIIDASLLYVTMPEFVDHVNSRNPHPNVPNVGVELDRTPYIWITGEDNQLNTISVYNLANLILGDDAANIPKMRTRISQAEVNIANLYMQINAETALGLKPNLLLIDDFKDSTCRDSYKTVVEHSVAGVADICVENVAGLHAGSWYTISDGVHNEFVQVKSVARNGIVEKAILKDTVVNTYDLPKTKLYRSTVSVRNDTANGAGNIKTFNQTFDTVWEGTSQDNPVQTLTLNTKNSNLDGFILSGDYAFNSSSQFTLKKS